MMPPRRAAPPAPLADVAAALGLPTEGGRTRCLNAAGRRHGADRRPSPVLYDDRYHCFACAAHGDAVDLVRAVRGGTFRDAVARLEGRGAGGPAGRSGSPPRGGSRPPGPDEHAVFDALRRLAAAPPRGSPAGGCLAGRGIDPGLAAAHRAAELAASAAAWDDLRRRFGVGRLRAAGLATGAGAFLFARHPLLFFYPDGGVPVFLQARALRPDAGPKELRPAGLACPVPYNRDVLHAAHGQVWVCGSCVDTLSAAQLGHRAVGVPGAGAFADPWLTLFPRHADAAIVFDNDKAGRAAGAELRTRFRMSGRRATLAPPAAGKDVNDLLRARQGGAARDDY